MLYATLWTECVLLQPLKDIVGLNFLEQIVVFTVRVVYRLVIFSRFKLQIERESAVTMAAHKNL